LGGVPRSITEPDNEPELASRHCVRPYESSEPVAGVLLIQLLDRARAAPLGRVAMTGAAAMAPFRMLRRPTIPFGTALFEMGVSLLIVLIPVAASIGPPDHAGEADLTSVREYFFP